MNIKEDTVKHVAMLSRLRLGKEELKLYSGQLGSILEYIDKLNKLNTDGVQPTSHVLPTLKNVFRKDEPKPSLDISEVLKNAPAKEDNFFKIPKVIEGK